jgi:hypothetical protein
MNVESQFWSLVEAANGLEAEARRWHNDDDSEPVDENRKVEPVYLAICELVTNHSAERDVFVRCFTELVLWKRQSPWLLVPFCMRVLRLSEVQQALAQEMDATRDTARWASRMNYCSSVMHAYVDAVWEQGIAFDTFANERTGV